MLHALCQYFTEQWEIERQQKAVCLQKRVRDLVVCGYSCGN